MILNAMLVTTCPGCKVTFRISDDLLQKADGQVRCGECLKIFDANSSLRELAEPRPEAETMASRRAETTDFAERQPEPEPEPTPQAPVKPAARPIIERDTAADTVQAHRRDSLRGQAAEPDWSGESEPGRRWPWAVAAGLLTAILGGQLVHQFRSELAAMPAIGQSVVGAYSLLGIDVAPAVDLDQYDLLDLTAAAQPFGEEPGWLIIETRVFNEGPSTQPYPHIFVRLLDRWDETVAGRYFGPEEYAVAAVDDFSEMSVGTATDAQFIIMDPGPSATGFELEICVPATGGFLCESDSVEQ